MKLSRDRCAAAVLLVAAAGAMWASTAYPLGTLAEPGPGLVPLLFSSVLAAGSALLLAIGGTPHALSARDFADLPITLVIIALLGAAALALEPAGYRATACGLLFAFIAVVERRPWWLAALLAAGFALASFYVINDLLRVPLPVNGWGW